MAAALPGCRPDGPPAKQAEEVFTAFDRIKQVAPTWEETTISEGFLADETIAFAKIKDTLRLTLGRRKNVALVDLRREELFRTRDGREFHCHVEGALQAATSYRWRLDEAILSLRMPATTMQRVCEESGLGRPLKKFSAVTATYALRGDQLVAIEPATMRSSLIPAN